MSDENGAEARTNRGARKSAKSGLALHSALLDGLREMIVRGEFADGEKLGEARLCARFGVSRTPLREALKALAAEGLVRLLPNRGSVVAPVDPEHMRDVFEAKGALERLIGLSAAQRATDADRRVLDLLHERLRQAARAADAGAYTRLNHEIHARLAAAAGNPVVARLYGGLQSDVLRARYAINADPDRLSRSLADHEEIMIAFRARARLDLADRLERHNAATGAAILSALSRLSSKDERSLGSCAEPGEQVRT